MVARLIEASTRRRVAEMRYFSVSSNRQKDYVVHPYLVEYSDGGLYLRAFVPESDEMRLFAVERIKSFKATGQSFTPVEAVNQSDFDPSLGMGMGKTERVQLEFSPRVAPYVRERVWHTSQKLFEDTADGGRAAHAEGVPRLGAARLGAQPGAPTCAWCRPPCWPRRSW